MGGFLHAAKDALHLPPLEDADSAWSSVEPSGIDGDHPVARLDLLLSAYSIARAGTGAAVADLFIEETKVRVSCTRCRLEGEATPNRLLCPSCGDWRVRVVSGEELILKSVGLRRVLAPA
jgi:Zn finger protein HypA/HybF involved in hydrogenase expression